MSDDTISRQAAIDVLEERLQANGYSNAALVSELNRSIGYLKRLPSAERRGRWIMHIDDIFPEESTMECDQCHEEQPLECDDKYCPRCGAIMDKEENE